MTHDRTEPEGAGVLALAMSAMRADPADDAARLAFYGALADSELFLMLEGEADAGALRPRLFSVEESWVALAFDSEAALADFAGEAVDYAALPGRVLVAMLAEAELALLVNPDSEDAAMLPGEALVWLAGTLLAPAPEATQAHIGAFDPPDLDAKALARLIPALERRLSGVPGLEAAVLASARFGSDEGGSRDAGLVLALAGVPEPVRPALARAMSEALVLSGLDEAALDVIFPAPGAMAAVAAVGLALSPAPFQSPDDPRQRKPRAAPGTDPARPPRLR